MLRVYALDEEEEWDAIVRSFQNYDVYWLSSYVRSFEMHGDGTPILFFYEDGSARGINVVMKRDIAKAPHFQGVLDEDCYYDLSTPYGYGGWLIEGNCVEQLFQAYFNWLEDNNIVSEFIRFHPMVNNQEACRGFYEIVQLGEVVCIDLSSPEVIWNNLSRENRNRIRKATKNDVHVYNGHSLDNYEQFRRIYDETMERKQADSYYFFEPEFYQTIKDELSQNSRVFWAEKDGKCIAASIMIYANGRMNFHLSGSLQEYNQLAPGNLIMYTAALWGYENKYKTLLLGGGVGSNDDTLLRYKKTFYKGEYNHFYIGKKVVSQEKYDYLAELCKSQKRKGFFPEYRSDSHERV